MVNLPQCSSEGRICPPAEAGAPVAKKPGDLAGDEDPAEDRRSNQRPKFYRRPKSDLTSSPLTTQNTLISELKIVF